MRKELTIVIDRTKNKKSTAGKASMGPGIHLLVHMTIE